MSAEHASVVALRPTPDSPSREGWTASVLEAVRPEFRRDVILPDRTNLALFGTPCAVTGCLRPARGRKVVLCSPHQSQFIKRGAGRTVAAWLALTADEGGPRVPRRLGELEVAPCAVHGCPRSAFDGPMCRSHHLRWRRTAGRPPLADYSHTTSPHFHAGPTAPPGSCRVPGCRFSRMPKSELCDSHHARFLYRRARHGHTLERYLEELAHVGVPTYDLAGLPQPLKAELQFALQSFSEQRSLLRLHDFTSALAALRDRGDRSLLDAVPDVLDGVNERAQSFLRFAREQLALVEDVRAGREEWDKDEWRIDRLPGLEPAARRGARRLSFRFCQEPWLRELLKRWIRWRLSCGLGASTAWWNLRGIRRFIEFCYEHDRPLRDPSDITRALLEDWMTHLIGCPIEQGTRCRWLGSVRLFLDDLRRHDWAPGLPANATYHRREFGPKPESLPRFLDEPIIAQLERDEALDQIPDRTTRTLVLVLIETGLRSIDACHLAIDPLSVDAAGAPYLRYYNHKLKRERYMPISPRLAEAIRHQQTEVRARFPHGEPCLFPAERKNPDGRAPFVYSTVNHRIHAWLKQLDLRDSNGQPVTVTPHQFRHTIATRMINKDVRQVVVQQMLDHNSPRMTNIYARLHDQTLREHFDRFSARINIRGEIVAPERDSPLADAVWAKENYARAKQTLPNGYCGLPLQQTCPHPNACLTCPNFLTGVEFLDVHRDQLQQTRDLLQDAREQGHQRLVQMNEPVELNLVRIIDGLEQLQEETADAA